MEKDIITVKNLHKTYSGEVPLHVLKGVSFSVKEGEFVAIMGRSGSGKSTLLHQLSLLDNADEGEIIVEGQELTALSDSEKTKFRLQHFGYVFQEYALLPGFSAEEAVSLPLILQGCSIRESKKRAREILEMVQLGDRIKHFPSEMSGGEQQRVAVARALVNNPKILFADEPCANLDSETSTVILELFRKLNKELNQTVILVTHESEDEEYVDRVIHMKDGILQ
ncbi:MAG TPA: ABC transporter ATP-binding protein [Candidatus Moranbacteria bacterium]|jgi:putative ABC transport system ATP-binding protein|nr:ABC transporter ATP-binding protein [Candidatus Moranbacteria bacterium]